MYNNALVGVASPDKLSAPVSPPIPSHVKEKHQLDAISRPGAFT